jgi:hypothetical protein
MLLVLSAALNKLHPQNRSLAYRGWNHESDFISRQMSLLNKENPRTFNLPNDTMAGYFSSSDYSINPDSFAVSGKLTTASHNDRSEVLKICSEFKTLFTALHHPGMI